MRYAPSEGDLGRAFIVLCPDLNQHGMFKQLFDMQMFRVERIRVAWVRLTNSLRTCVEILVSHILNGLY